MSDAKDDGAAFAVAQSVRSDVAGLSSANEQLGGAQGLLDTTNAALKNVSNTMAQARGVLTKLAGDSLSTDERAQYTSQYTALKEQMDSFVEDANYNDKSLIKGGAAAVDNVTVISNEKADQLTFTAVDGETFKLAAAPADAAAAKTALAAGGDFELKEKAINDAMNKFGSDSKKLAAQVSFNKEKIDALEGGIGALVDADLAKESAKLQSLQIRQQLGTQSLSIANQAPQTLMSLFR